MTESYAHPPIYEAVCEFHFFGDTWGFTTGADLYRALEGDYPAQPQTHQQMFSGPSPEPASVQVGLASRLMFTDHAGERIVMVTPGVLSVHAVRSYPRWDGFRSRTEVALAKFREVCRPTALRRVAVRAINQISIPSDAKDLSAWLVNAPRALNDRMGTPLLSAFQATFACPSGDWLIVNLSTPPPQDSTPERTVMLDLNAISAEGPEENMAWDDAMKKLDELHGYVGEAFEASITETLREKFRATTP